MTVKSWKAIYIRLPWDSIEEIGLWKILWGADVFINNVPVLKSIVLANIITWLILFWSLKW